MDSPSQFVKKVDQLPSIHQCICNVAVLSSAKTKIHFSIPRLPVSRKKDVFRDVK